MIVFLTAFFYVKHESCHCVTGFSLVVLIITENFVHYYKKDLLWPFENALRGGPEFQPPRLMPDINQDGYFSLIEKVMRLQETA
jgi:hypothetical protein